MDTLELNHIIEITLSIIATIGGGTGIYFWRVNRDLKKEEVKEKQVSIEDKQQQIWSKQNDEFQEYIKLLKEDNAELKKENKEKDAVITEMRNTLNDVVIRVGNLENQIKLANFYRCENMSCTGRISSLKK